jgi:predicted outer membrane repeat protein
LLELLETRLAPATLTITSTLDDGSAGTLRAAIVQANTDAANGVSDTVNFSSSLSGATVVLTQGQLELSGGGGGTITIDGSSVSSQVTITGNNASRVFLVDAGVQAEIDDVTITDGTVSDSGGGIANSGTLTVAGSSFSNNSAYTGAGIENTGGLTVSNCIFTQNTAGYYGAGMANEVGARLTVSQCTFSNNSARDGAGINSNADLTVRDSTFAGNTVTDFGGGFSGGGRASFDNSAFYGNSAGYLGGAINEGDGTLVLRNCIISGNTATIYGGGIEVNNSVTTVSNCTITGNTAQV